MGENQSSLRYYLCDVSRLKTHGLSCALVNDFAFVSDQNALYDFVVHIHSDLAVFGEELEKVVNVVANNQVEEVGS